MTTRWQSVVGVADAVAERSRVRNDFGGPAWTARHDQDTATIRDYLTRLGVDLDDRDQVLALIAGAISVVTVANCEHQAERATDLAVKVVDNFAEQLISHVVELLPAEASS